MLDALGHQTGAGLGDVAIEGRGARHPRAPARRLPLAARRRSPLAHLPGSSALTPAPLTARDFMVAFAPRRHGERQAAVRQEASLRRSRRPNRGHSPPSPARAPQLMTIKEEFSGERVEVTCWSPENSGESPERSPESAGRAVGVAERMPSHIGAATNDPTPWLTHRAVDSDRASRATSTHVHKIVSRRR
jgi:hypothetical protein